MTKSISEKKKLDKLTQGTIIIDLAIACHLRDLLLGANNGKVWKVTEVSGHISEPEINCGMRERRKIILDRGSRNTQCTSICKVCVLCTIVSQDEITEVEIGHQSRPDHNVRASLPCCALLTMWKHQSNIITLPPSGFNLIRVTLFEKKSQQAVMHTSNTKYYSTTVWKIWYR